MMLAPNQFINAIFVIALFNLDIVETWMSPPSPTARSACFAPSCSIANLGRAAEATWKQPTLP